MTIFRGEPMNWTNVHNLPAPLVSAILNDPYDRQGDISITGLIRSPRQRILEKRHDAEIAQDVSDRLWSLLGQSVHAILERADTTNHLSEERLGAELHGWKITGKPDLLTPEMIIQDYKVTSVYSFLLGEKREWEEQLNLYAWLYRQHGFNAVGLQIVAILRDWMANRAAHEPDYPQAGFIVRPVPLWSVEEQEAEIGVRVRVHQTAERVPDDVLPDCTAEERWQREDSWAVKKKGNKRAYRVFNNGDDAVKLAADMKDTVVEYRPGESIKCLRYCVAAPFCSQFKAMERQWEGCEE